MDAYQSTYEVETGMITGSQLRAGRALLGWSLERLTQESGVSESTIRRAENVDYTPRMRTDNLLALQTALERGGCMFIAASDVRPGGEGVRRRQAFAENARQREQIERKIQRQRQRPRGRERQAPAFFPVEVPKVSRSMTSSETDEDELFLMVNLTPRLTRLPMTVWVRPEGGLPHDVRIKVNMTHGRRMSISNTAVVAVRPVLRLIAGHLSPTDLTQVSDWIWLNEAAIVDYRIVIEIQTASFRTRHCQVSGFRNKIWQ